MIVERLAKLHQHEFAVGIGDIGVARTDCEARDARAQGPTHIVVEVEIAIGRVIGVKGQAEQTGLHRAIAGIYTRSNIEKRRGQKRAILHNLNPPHLLGDKETAIPGMGNIGRLAETADNAVETQRSGRWRGADGWRPAAATRHLDRQAGCADAIATQTLLTIGRVARAVECHRVIKHWRGPGEGKHGLVAGKRLGCTVRQLA